MAGISYWKALDVALPLLAFIINLSFGIFILRRKRIRVNRLFTLLMLVFCWWNIGDFGMRLATDANTASLMLKFIDFATPLIAPVTLAFMMALENKTPSRRQLAIMIIGSVIFISMDLTGLLVSKPAEIRSTFEGYMVPDMPVSIYNGYVYFAIYMMIFISYAIYRLFRFYRTCDNEMVKKRIKYMLIGACITAIASFITEFFVPLGLSPISIPSLGSFSTIVYTSFTYYSVRSR